MRTCSGARSILYIVLTAIFAFSVCSEASGQHKKFKARLNFPTTGIYGSDLAIFAHAERDMVVPMASEASAKSAGAETESPKVGDSKRAFILVIDPGHGGEDPGAIRGRYNEKDLNLDIALALGAAIGREIPGVDVLYTRTGDTAVGLAARGDFANRAGADLFLSIHTNANKSSSAYGSETYVMGIDKTEANLEVAKLENEVIKYEEDYTETYAGFDPGSPEMEILFGMMQYASFESSLTFARLIQKRFASDTALRDRGAKQGPFAVLWRPTMPRVLTEVGFISNDSDRKYIFSDRGKKAIVKALLEAFREYKTLLDDSSDADVAATPTTSTPTTTTPTPTTTPTTTTAPAKTPATAPTATPATTPTATPAPAPADKFYVQLAASKTRIRTNDPSWAPYRRKVVERYIDGWYKYALGPFDTREEAAKKLKEVRRTKFRDAFIVK